MSAIAGFIKKLFPRFAWFAGCLLVRFQNTVCSTPCQEVLGRNCKEEARKSRARCVVLFHRPVVHAAIAQNAGVEGFRGFHTPVIPVPG
jgi:hypothetical protein